jgi:cytochrome P450 family 144
VVLHTLLSAGGESTTSLLGNAVRLLAERQELQSLLRGSPELIPAFIEEALRLESPFRFLLRTTAHDTVLNDVDIPAGATVLLLWGAANRDAAIFENPDAIVLEREVPKRHVAFGRGIHHCVGASLARLEARIVLESLLERTKGFTLDPNEPPRWVQSLMVRRHDHLVIRVTRS